MGCTLIVMVTYYRLDLTKQSVNSILNNTKAEFDLSIIDNGSQDGTADYLRVLKRKYPNIRARLLDKNIGKGAAANKIFKEIDRFKYDYIVGIDNDIIVPENWLSVLIDCSKYLDKWGLLAPNHAGVHKILPRAKKKHLPNKQTLIFNPCIAGGTWLINKKLYRSIGGYREDRFYGGVDGDYNIRAQKAGFRNGIVKDIFYRTINHPKYKPYSLFKLNQVVQMRKQPGFQAKCGFFENRKNG